MVRHKPDYIKHEPPIKIESNTSSIIRSSYNILPDNKQDESLSENRN